jgi:hypothetical protein
MTYIALEDLDFMWTDDDLITVKEMWTGGKSLDSIAVRVKRPLDEVAVLIMDLARKEKIILRTSGFEGNKEVTEKCQKPRNVHKYTQQDIALAKQNGIKYATFFMRIQRGWSVQEAATKKSNRKQATGVRT